MNARGILLGCLFATSVASAEGNEQAYRKLLLMTQYVGSDYRRAVKDGAVANPAEYDESLQTAADALKLYQQFRPDGAQLALFNKLSEQVKNKASPDDVTQTVQTLVPALTSEFHLTPAPTRWPDLDEGREQFLKSCTGCHGVDGKGDGPAAASLKPHPPDMSDPAWADFRAPFQLFNTITLGLENSAMVAFGPILSDDTRWALAFYVLTFRKPAHPPKLHPTLTLTELASSTNMELTEKVMRKGDAPKEAALAMVDAARRAMPEKLTPPRAMDLMKAAALKAGELAAQGNRTAAADLVGSTYFDAVEPVEAQLRTRLEPDVSLLESRITALRRALSGTEPVQPAVDAVVAQADAIKTRWAIRPPPAPSGAPWGVLSAVALCAAVLLVGLFSLGRRRPT